MMEIDTAKMVVQIWFNNNLWFFLFRFCPPALFFFPSFFYCFSISQYRLFLLTFFTLRWGFAHLWEISFSTALADNFTLYQQPAVFLAGIKLDRLFIIVFDILFDNLIAGTLTEHGAIW